MKKHLLHIVLFFCLLQQFQAQEDGVVGLDIPVRTSLKFNRTFINPTFSFVREQNKYISFNNNREFAQFDNAPQTYLFGYSGRFRENIGAGLSLFQQNYGVLSTFGGVANFAYNVSLDRYSNLTFGMNLGIYSSGVNDGKVISNDSDPVLNDVPSNTVFTINPGFNYGTEFLDFGVALNNIVSYNFAASEVIEENPQQGVQIHAMYTGYFNSRGFFDESKFSALIRSEFRKDQTIVSGIMMVSVPKGFWGQTGYNTLYGFSVGVGLNITSQIALEYNYEQAVGAISALGNSHDITLAYRFKNKDRYYDEEEAQGLIIPEKSYKSSKKVTQSVTPKDLPRKSSTAPTQAQLAAAAAERERRAAAAAALQGKVEAERLAEIEAERLKNEAAAQQLAEAERLRKEEEARLAEAAQLKEEQEAARLAEAERLRQTEAARLAEEARIAEAEEAARLAEAERVRLAEEARLAEAERFRREEAARLAEAEQLKAEQEAARLAEAERLRQVEAARLAEEARIAEEAEAARLAEAERLRKEEEARLAEEARLKAEQEAARLAEAERLRQVEAARLAEEARIAEEAEAARLAEAERLRLEEEARLAEVARLEAEQEAARLAEAERLRKEEEARLAEEARIAEQAAAASLADQEAARLAAELEKQKAEEADMAKAIMPTDATTRLMNDISRSVYETGKEQKLLLDKLTEKVASKQQDLDDLIEENNLSEKGIVKAPKAFKSISQENRELDALTLEIENLIHEQNNKIRKLDKIYNDRLKEVPDLNEATNKFYRERLEILKREQVEALQLRQGSIFKIEALKEEIKEERKRRIKRALYDNEADRYAKDRAALKEIKESTSISSVPLKPSDFDYGEELSNIQIVKGINNVEDGYYLVVAVHTDVDKRDEFLRKAVAAGQNNINFFFDVNTSKYYIYYENYSGINQAQSALSQKGTLPYNGKMSLVKVEK